MRRVLDKSCLKAIKKIGYSDSMLSEYCMPSSILIRENFSLEEFEIIEKFLKEKEDGVDFKSISNEEAIINGTYVRISMHKSKKKFQVTVGDDSFYVDRELLTNIVGVSLEMNVSKTLLTVYRERGFLKGVSSYKGGSHLIMKIDARESLEKATMVSMLLNTKSYSLYTVQYRKQPVLINCKEFDFNMKKGKIYFVFKDGNYIESEREESIFEYLSGDNDNITKLGLLDRVYQDILEVSPTVEEISYIFSVPEKDAELVIENSVSVDLFRVHLAVSKICSNKSYLKYKFLNLERKDLFLKIINQN